MRVCIFTGTPDIRGGTTRYVHDLAEGLRTNGHTVEIVVRQGGFWSEVFRLRRHAKRVQIVHSIDLNPRGYIAYFATLFTNAKLVITVQGSYGVAPLDNKRTAFLSRVVYRTCAAIVAISSFIKREIDRRMQGAHVVVITHGVDLAKFQRTPGSAETRPPYMLGVGSIKRRKGYETALRAFIMAKKEVPELRYVIVGAQIDDPNYVRLLKNLAKENGVEDSVDFVYDISDERLRELYEGAAFFILTSVNEGGHFEGFGLVFLEAAAYGLPSIGTTGNGIEDAVVDAVTGLLVPQFDSVATKEAIVHLARDPEYRKVLSEGAREHAEARAWPHVIKEYEVLYSGILAK